MKKVWMGFALVLVVALALPSSYALVQDQDQEQEQEQKTIKDPAEYNAYISAVNEPDPKAKASALEGFLQAYPNSVVKEDALLQLMVAYQQAGNAAQAIATAERLLQAEPHNLRALALLVYAKRAAAEAGQNVQQNVAAVRDLSQRGLQALDTAKMPAGMSDADWENFKNQLGVIFHGGLGFAAMQNKDYKAAIEHLSQVVKATPEDLRTIYPLAIAYLEEQPLDPTGFWYIARAVSLSNRQAEIVKYGRTKYVAYHGTEEGWPELVQEAKNTPFPPPGFMVKADTPADRAARLAKSRDPKEMSLDEWELILANAEPAVAETVWTEIKSLGSVAFQGVVIAADKDRLTLAGTVDAIKENRGNVELQMRGEIPSNLMPQEGQEIAVQGKPVSYSRDPFILTMDDGVLIRRNTKGGSR